MVLDRIPVRLRLSLGHATWMAVLYGALGFGLYKIVENNLYSSVDAALIASARSVRDARYSWSEDEGAFHDTVIDKFFRDPLYVDQFTGERYIRPFAQIINVSGKVHSRTNNIPVTLPTTPNALVRADEGKPTFETFILKDRAPLRQVTLPVMKHGLFTGDLIQVGASLRQTVDTLRGTMLLLWLVLPFALFVSIVLGYVLTARALRPVRQITQAAASMGIYDLSYRLAIPAARDELSELSETFNAMLERLEDAVKRLRRFTGDVSHELRTPLAVLRGEAELALRKERPAPEYRESLQTIVKEAKNMTGIIEDLLLLAKAESNSVAMFWVVIGVEDLVRELRDSVAAIYNVFGVTLEYRIAGVQTINCSKAYLFLALKNILLNAAKHSTAGKVVTIEVYREDENIVFRIQDQGEGIPSDAIAYIFDPFFRADTARNRSSGGVGIGLSLALALVKLHGGNIKVQSKPQAGTIFWTSIPLKKADTMVSEPMGRSVRGGLLHRVEKSEDRIEKRGSAEKGEGVENLGKARPGVGIASEQESTTFQTSPTRS